MGGADPGGDWHLYPEEPAVLVGTQDMLLSRALNRGYACGRARWPLEFGLLNHDALWVMDEVQLMDVGLATSAQLQAYLDADSDKGFRPRHTWWMSATLQPAWLRSVDTEPRIEDWTCEPEAVGSDHHSLLANAARKTLEIRSVSAEDTQAFAQLVRDTHAGNQAGAWGCITLVVCNTVRRARDTYDELRLLDPGQEIRLVHSRFRGTERDRWRREFLDRTHCGPDANRIIVATQVVEAGVDMSAGCVVTELAPWPNLVQRFGRCARYGGEGRCIVVDRGLDDASCVPYALPEVTAALAAVKRFADGGDVGLAALTAFDETLDDDQRRSLFPYEPRHLLLRREFIELFDTTPDLTGADLDISRFIRSGDEKDLSVFWRDVPKPEKGRRDRAPDSGIHPRRVELCAVPFLQARDWLCGGEKKDNRKPRLRAGMRAWVWDWLNAEWITADRAMLTPGRVVCVAAECGGYDTTRGFDPDAQPALPVPQEPAGASTDASEVTDQSDGADALSAAAWKTIACHVGEVEDLAIRIVRLLKVNPEQERIVQLAARWHDVGKAHPAFQGAIRINGQPLDRHDLAKAPRDCWPKRPQTYRTPDDRDTRPGLRHELASALALFAVLARHQPRHDALLGPWVEALEITGHSVPDDPPSSQPTPSELEVLACNAAAFDLLVYLVASHHGKVRVALHAGPKDQDYREPADGRGLPIRGIRDGDTLPPVMVQAASPAIPSLTLSLEPASLGLSPVTGRSWRERTLGLVDRFGPSGLAWLEALLIAADRRASRLETADPALAGWEASR
jgi:CRISPR-associated endonuclease/helicase Cas3